ncbi:MAG: (2Fe-2S) ferredoxin domain-containing protein [Nitrospiria bacterium]
MESYSKHIFVCQGNDCFQKGSEEIRAEFRKQLMDRNLFDKEVKVNKSGCFDQCKYGVNVVIYPEGTWYCNVEQSSVKKIIEKHIMGGEIVTNLLHYQMSAPQKNEKR